MLTNLFYLFNNEDCFVIASSVEFGWIFRRVLDKIVPNLLILL